MDDKMLMVVGVALLVSVLASYTMVAMTSNVIRVSPATTAQEVYTKADIDNRFSRCMTWTITSADEDTVQGSMTGDQICKENKLPGESVSANQKCLWSGLLGEEKNEFGGTTQDLRIVDSGICSLPLKVYFEGGYKQVTTFCC